jgi:hypothetical protein
MGDGDVAGDPGPIDPLAITLIPWWWPSFARRIVYAITDQRLLIIQSWPRRRIASHGRGA